MTRPNTNVVLLLACLPIALGLPLPSAAARAPKRQPASEPPTAAPPGDESSEAADTPTGGVGEAILRAVVGEEVIVSVANGEMRGVLRDVGDESVVLVGPGGEVLEVQREAIEAIRLAPEAPPPAPAATVVESRPAAAMCMGDDFCDHPRKCIAGECRIDPLYVDALEKEGENRRKHGLHTMIAGAAIAGAGIVILTVAFSVGAAAWDKHWGKNCGSGGNRQMASDAYCERLSERHFQAWDAGLAGTAVVGIGAIILIAGGGAYGMGKNKLRRAREHRRTLDLSIAAPRRGFGIALGGRF